jgi:hypothetical protein
MIAGAATQATAIAAPATQVTMIAGAATQATVIGCAATQATMIAGAAPRQVNRRDRAAPPTP